jgi:phage repressor protein C with HTH and peptisase S24 domain
MHQGEYLKKLVDKSGLTVEEFAKNLGTSRPNMYELYKKKAIDDYYLDKIRQMGLDLDTIKPQKALVKPVLSIAREPNTPYVESQDAPIPYYEANVTGGNVNNFGEQVRNASYFLTIPHFKDCTIAVRVNGHSMYPKYCNGDIVVCKKINDHSHIPYGEPHIVVMSDYSVLKYVHPHPTDKTLFVLKSANEKFEPMEIKRDDVLGVYLVRGKLELT